MLGLVHFNQVYKAWLHGKPVAVKVQRPDLLETAGLDFYLARSIAAVITRVSQESHAFGGRLAIRSDLVAAVDEYGSRLFEELDYRIEVGLARDEMGRDASRSIRRRSHITTSRLVHISRSSH